jgi:transcriptional regulator with XRE-family HTH domain
MDERFMTGRTRKSEPVDAHVGARIRLKRIMIGMTQNKLGESLGITFQQIQKYEKGVNRVGAGRLQAIADLFNVPITFFFENMPGQPGNTKEFDDEIEIANLLGFLNSPEGIQLARAFANIGDVTIRRKILDLVSALGSGKDLS